MAAVMPPGQQGKDEGFPGLRRHADSLTAADGQTTASALQFPHQHGVSAAASGHHQFQEVNLSPRLDPLKILGHHGRAEAGEGGHRIGGRDRPQLSQATLEILTAKAFTPR